METDSQELISTAELAEMLGVPIATIYQWRHKGSGPPALRIGRHLRFRLRDIEAWLDGCTDSPEES